MLVITMCLNKGEDITTCDTYNDTIPYIEPSPGSFILNPDANFFNPRNLVYDAVLLEAEMEFLATSCVMLAYVLNPRAKSFVKE